MGGTSIPEESWKDIINSIDKNGDGEVSKILSFKLNFNFYFR